MTLTVFGRPFVKRFGLCCRTVVCPVLSVTLVYCGQTVGWIKIQLGVEVGLGPGHIALDGDPAPLPQRGTAPLFGPSLLRPNGRMDQDATWYVVGLGPDDIMLDGNPASPKKGHSPHFLALVCCGQTDGWIKMSLGTR